MSDMKSISPEEFISLFYRKVIESNTKIYNEMYIEGFDQPSTDPYMRRAFDLVSRISTKDRETLLSIIKQIMIDTSSNIFGIFDGITDFSPFNEAFKITYGADGELINGELQSAFLARSEED